MTLSHPWDAERALRSLDDGLAVIAPDRSVLFANDALRSMLQIGEQRTVGMRELTPLGAEANGLDAVFAGSDAKSGTHTYRIELPDGGATRTLEVALRRCGDGTALLRARDVSATVATERAAIARVEENESLRVIACLLAEETDVEQVLLLLSAQAASQCCADGATVIEVALDQGRAVASVGCLQPVQGRGFRVQGSLAERAIRARSPIAVDDYLRDYSGHSWADVARELDTGPVLLAPLFAHDQVMGIVTVVRRRGRAPFGETEIRRLRALADQAALALWKSHLLAEAQSANEAKNEFIAVMSHELRTPLAAVAGYEELLSDEILGPLNDEQHNAIDRMRWGTRLLSSIIEEILTFSRLESGEVQPALVEVRAGELLRSAAAVLHPLAAARDLALAVSVPDDALTVRTDPEILRRVLVNLGSNAVKFTEHGSVELLARRLPGAVCFSVRDTGIGIAPENMARIFEAFTQLHTGINRPYGGTGLGLHTANRLVRLLGGELTVESTPGAGSTFFVRLPAG